MHDVIPSQVRQVEFTLLQYQLQFEADFEFSLATLLQLRRELRQAIGLSGVAESQRRQLLALIDPPDLIDPVARRRFRKPSPGFVLQSPERLPQSLSAGDEITLPVLFLGRARNQIILFTELLQALGLSGIAGGEGPFSLQSIRVEGPSPRQTIWTSEASLVHLSVPYQDLGWWLDQRQVGETLIWSIETPARLMKQHKPLFHAGFSELFPFALRRVTSMLYAWGGCELANNPSELLLAADSVTTVHVDLHWRDWRVLDGSPQRQELGGLCGKVELAGDQLASIGWILQLLELFNLGKGAAYGAGQCVIRAGKTGCQTAD